MTPYYRAWDLFNFLSPSVTKSLDIQHLVYKSFFIKYSTKYFLLPNTSSIKSTDHTFFFTHSPFRLLIFKRKKTTVYEWTLANYTVFCDPSDHTGGTCQLQKTHLIPISSATKIDPYVFFKSRCNGLFFAEKLQRINWFDTLSISITQITRNGLYKRPTLRSFKSLIAPYTHLGKPLLLSYRRKTLKAPLFFLFAKTTHKKAFALICIQDK